MLGWNMIILLVAVAVFPPFLPMVLGSCRIKPTKHSRLGNGLLGSRLPFHSLLSLHPNTRTPLFIPIYLRPLHISPIRRHMFYLPRCPFISFVSCKIFPFFVLPLASCLEFVHISIPYTCYIDRYTVMYDAESGS